MAAIDATAGDPEIDQPSAQEEMSATGITTDVCVP